MNKKDKQTKNSFKVFFFIACYFLLMGFNPFILSNKCYAGQLILSWNANTEPGVTGYKVYYGSSSRNYTTSIDVGNNTTYTLSVVPVSNTYFAVTAYNSFGTESTPSDEVIYTPTTTTTTQPVTTTTTIRPVTTTTTSQSVTTTTTIRPVTTTTTSQPVTTTTTSISPSAVYVPTDYKTIKEALNSINAGATVYIEDNATYDGFTITKNFITVQADASKGAKPIINGAPVTIGTERTAIYITGNNATVQGLTINSENSAYSKTIIVEAVDANVAFKAFNPPYVNSIQISFCGIDAIAWQNKNAGSSEAWNACSSVEVDSVGCSVVTVDTQNTVPSISQLADIVFASGKITAAPATTTTTITTSVPGGTTSSGGGGGGGAAGTDNQSTPQLGCKADKDCSEGLVCNTLSGMCVECLNDGQCDDGLYCNGAESCSNNSCRQGPAPCGAGELCSEELNICIAEAPLPQCSTDADCSDGLYCNGQETCLDGACVSGVAPCGENQKCDEEQGACFDVITVSTEDVINNPRKPIFVEKLRQWLIIPNTGSININDAMAEIKIQGNAEDFHGVEIDTTRKWFQLMNYIFIPVYIHKDATSGKWTIVIKCRQGEVSSQSKSIVTLNFL